VRFAHKEPLVNEVEVLEFLIMEAKQEGRYVPVGMAECTEMLDCSPSAPMAQI